MFGVVDGKYLVLKPQLSQSFVFVLEDHVMIATVMGVSWDLAGSRDKNGVVRLQVSREAAKPLQVFNSSPTRLRR